MPEYSSKAAIKGQGNFELQVNAKKENGGQTVMFVRHKMLQFCA